MTAPRALEDAVLAGLHALPSVSLAELTGGAAALMTRTDRKYLVPEESLADVVGALGALDSGAGVLEIAGRRRHTYVSTYLDSPGLDSYWGAARRRRHRFKVRTRRYVDSGHDFTEVKTRGPRSTNVKARIPREAPAISDSSGLLSASETQFVAGQLASAGVGRVDVSALVSTVSTAYDRSTLWLPQRGARVTIDRRIAWSARWMDGQLRVPGLAIVETKAAGARAGVDRALWQQGHRPVSISKYATGLALLLPELPAHRWHRVLERDLRPRLVNHHTRSTTQEIR